MAVRVRSLQSMEQDYQQQNQQLRQLQREREARRQASSAQQEQPAKEIKPIQEQKWEEWHNPDFNIWLNTLVYDQRPKQRKYTLSLANLLHEDVKCRPMKAASPNIEGLMISTYGYEMEVLAPVMTMGFPVFIVNRDSEIHAGYVKRKHDGIDNFTLISPPKVNKSSYGVFHTKLWLIKFKTFLRVVVCTSNQHLMDWTMWQNAYWYHDCPIRTIAEAGQPVETQGFNNEVDFRQTLEWVIGRMQPENFNLLAEMKVKLNDYSWKGIEPILIPSNAGKYMGENLNKMGMNKLRSVIRKNNALIKKPTITCSCSSLGRVVENYIAEVEQCFATPLNSFAPQRFKLVYPTEEYIHNRSCGMSQVLWYSLEDYKRCDIKNTLFHRYQPSANGVKGTIPHLKTIIAESEESQTCVLYVGSHNLTRAAWGNYQKNGMQIKFSNDELGLLFLKYPKNLLRQWLPYQYPPPKYSNKDVPFIAKR